MTDNVFFRERLTFRSIRQTDGDRTAAGLSGRSPSGGGVSADPAPLPAEPGERAARRSRRSSARHSSSITCCTKSAGTGERTVKQLSHLFTGELTQHYKAQLTITFHVMYAFVALLGKRNHTFPVSVKHQLLYHSVLPPPPSPVPPARASRRYRPRVRLALSQQLTRLTTPASVSR